MIINNNNTTFTPITYRNDLSRYMINTKGEIYNIYTHKVLSGTINTNGYKTYLLRTDDGKVINVLAHIAVAKEYIPNHDKSKTIVNHIDEDKTNSDVTNLEWVTPKQNTNHGTGMVRSSNKRKKPIAEYSIHGEYIRTWKSVRDISRFYADLWECDAKHMTSIENSIYGSLKGNSNTAYGRIWRYAGIKPLKQIDVPQKIIDQMICSPSKIKLDYSGKVPDEYLHHEMTKKEIIDYFMAHERLTDNEKDMLRSILKIPKK